MEYVITVVCIIAAIVLLWLMQKYLVMPFVIWNERRKLEAQAKAQLMREMAWARATQSAADKILRKNGQRP